MTFWDLLRLGGVTMYFLMLLSIFSIAVIIERLFLYGRAVWIPHERLMGMVRLEMTQKHLDQARDFCLKSDTPSARVVLAGLGVKNFRRELMESAMERQIVIETMRLEKRISIVGTIGSTAVYVGLFGTVLGIINAFQELSSKSSGGVPTAINGIGEALVCTAVGLCVAVPAVVAYNYFVKKVDDQVKAMELCASETMDLCEGQ